MNEMKGHGESTITLAHCQTWILMATYEFKQMYSQELGSLPEEKFDLLR
jgi:hypothetical protein